MTASDAGAITGALIVAWLAKNKQMGHILLILFTLFGTIIVGLGLSRRPSYLHLSCSPAVRS